MERPAIIAGLANLLVSDAATIEMREGGKHITTIKAFPHARNANQLLPFL